MKTYFMSPILQLTGIGRQMNMNPLIRLARILRLFVVVVVAIGWANTYPVGVGCWGDNTFSNDGYSGLEMVEDPYRDEERFDSYYNSDKEMDVPLANEHKSLVCWWFWLSIWIR